MQNFRIYKGPVDISFANGDKNITIIQGDNEIGKTTIMNAIWWCLYGREPFKDEGMEFILNRDTFLKMDIGDEEKVIVRLNMEDKKGKEVIFQRELSFGKITDDDALPEQNSEFIITVDGDLVSHPDTYKNTHLPEKIREYFLFDGEQLENYFVDDNSKNIKAAVLKLSQLNLLSKIKRHIKDIRKDFINDLDNVKPNESKLLNKKLTVEQNLNKLKSELEDIEKNIPLWDKIIDKLEESLKSFGENPKKLVKNRKQLQDELKAREKELSNEKREYTSFLVNSFNKIFSWSLLNNVQRLTDDLEDKGFIPAKYKKEFLDYLLENNECICGADLSEGSEAHEKIVELCRRTDEITNVADDINVLRGQIKSLKSDFPKNFAQDLLSLKLSIDDKTKLRDKVDEDIENINSILDSSNDEEILKLNSEIKFYKTLIRTNSEKKGSLKNQIPDLENKLKEIKFNIDKEKSKTKISNDIELSIDFCDDVLDEVRDIYDKVNEEIHNELERLTSEEFKKIHWKDSYDEVLIDENYNITLMSKGSKKSPADLSAGGKLSLALSFTTALNSLSGFELPILIDTPMGRLGESIKENIGKNLHNYVVGKQVTFIVTDSEYSEGFKSGILEFIGKEYKLKHHLDKGEYTEVEEIK